MTIETWWFYTCAVFLLCATPGPNMLYVMSTSARAGLGHSVAAMAGCMTALLLMLGVSAMGLAAVLLAWPALFEALRYAGVAYLLYLGVKAWRQAGRGADLDGPAVPRSSALGRLYRGGLATGLSNPKAILFAAAFLPQFIDPARPQGAQFAILVGTFVVTESFWYAMYALGGRSLGRRLARPGAARLFDRLTGALFIGFGMALLGARH